MATYINNGIKSIKTGDKVINSTYLLSCPKCGRLWWSKQPFPKTCLNCRENNN